MTEQIGDQTGEAPSTESLFRRALKSQSTPRAQAIQLRLLTVLLFLLGVLLTFSDKVYDFLERFTDRPEILPVALMVPYVYLIFQVVLWRLDRDDEAELRKIRFEVRRSELHQQLLERRIVVDAFNRSVAGFRNYDKHGGVVALSDWIAAEEGGEIEVLMVAYSSETFLDGCLRAARRVQEVTSSKGQQPDKIVFKLLTRDLSVSWRLPFLPVYQADQDYRHALNARFQQFLSRWKVELFDAFAFLPRDRVQFEARSYPLEPTYKATIVNRKVGLVGVYGTHEVNYGGVSGWDYHGHGARTYELRINDDVKGVGQLALDNFIEYFDLLWNRHSRPVDDF